MKEQIIWNVYTFQIQNGSNIKALVKIVKILSVRRFWILSKKRLLTNMPHNKLETYQAHIRIPQQTIIWCDVFPYISLFYINFSLQNPSDTAKELSLKFIIVLDSLFLYVKKSSELKFLFVKNTKICISTFLVFICGGYAHLLLNRNETQ